MQSETLISRFSSYLERGVMNRLVILAGNLKSNQRLAVIEGDRIIRAIDFNLDERSALRHMN